MQEFGKPEPKTVLLQAQTVSQRRPPSPPPTYMRSDLQPPSHKHFPPAPPVPPPHLAAAARSLPRATTYPPHSSKQPLTLHAAAAARSMPYKSGARKYRWKGAQGHSFCLGFVHVGTSQGGGDYGDMVVVHTDQVSQQLVF